MHKIPNIGYIITIKTRHAAFATLPVIHLVGLLSIPSGVPGGPVFKQRSEQGGVVVKTSWACGRALRYLFDLNCEPCSVVVCFCGGISLVTLLWEYHALEPWGSYRHVPIIKKQYIRTDHILMPEETAILLRTILLLYHYYVSTISLLYITITILLLYYYYMTTID